MDNVIGTSRVDEVVEAISNGFIQCSGLQLSSYELSIIKEELLFTRSPSPNTYATALEDLEKLNRLESEYNYFIYKLDEIYRGLYNKFHLKYDISLANISRSGVVNNQAAAVAIVMSKSTDNLQELENMMNRAQNLLNYFKNELSTLKSRSKYIDAKRSNTL